MLEKVLFLLEYNYRKCSLPDAADAVRAYREMGLTADLLYLEEREDCARRIDRLEAAKLQTLCLTDSGRILRALLAAGAAAAGFLHAGNRAESLKGVDYLLEEPQWISPDSLQKVWQRQRHLPWNILETKRCCVREFVPSDLGAIYRLYDAEANRFLEGPSADTEKEAAILRAYIERIYRLYGYGQWAVLEKARGELIGRIGFSFPTGGEAALCADASFGFLIRMDWRHRGIAAEVCEALVRYGFAELGFERISAEASPENAASDALLRKLGFVRAEPEKRIRGKYFYLLENGGNGNDQ